MYLVSKMFIFLKKFVFVSSLLTKCKISTLEILRSLIFFKSKKRSRNSDKCVSLYSSAESYLSYSKLKKFSKMSLKN